MSRISDTELDALLYTTDEGYQGYWPSGGASTFHATLGATPGYGHNNESTTTVGQVAAAWQEITATQADVYEGIIPGCVIHEAVVAYATEHGCPTGGERIFVLTGVANPKFVHHQQQWRAAAQAALVKIAARFGQSTVQVVMTATGLEIPDFTYYYRRNP